METNNKAKDKRDKQETKDSLNSAKASTNREAGKDNSEKDPIENPAADSEIGPNIYDLGMGGGPGASTSGLSSRSDEDENRDRDED